MRHSGTQQVREVDGGEGCTTDRAIAPVVIPVYYLPMMIFEIGLGLWLLTKGLTKPESKR